MLDLDAWLLALILGLAMLAAWGLGWRAGRTLRALKRAHFSKFDDASLALLGLLLAFTFGMSIVKHDNRRQALVADSNAIGDFYTCASLTKEPERSKLQALLRSYVELRLEVSRQRMRARAFDKVLLRFEQMQAEMTSLVAEALSDGTPVAIPLTNTLNAMTSAHAARIAAVKDQLPASIVMLLFVSAVGATFLIGREQSVSGKTDIMGTVFFVLLVSLAVYVTLDLNQPARGLITVSQEPLQRLLLSMTK